MACINPDGTLSGTALLLLRIIKNPLTPEEIAAQIGIPLFRIRSSLRELVAAGLVIADGDKYIISETGKTKL